VTFCDGPYFLNTVTSKIAGVIKEKIQPQHNIKKALQELANLSFKFIFRVIFSCRLFTVGRSPIAVINAAERKVVQDYAGFTEAVRTLVDDYKLRVVVDGSPNYLDETLLRTERERVIDIKPLTSEMIWQLEQLQEFFKYDKDAGLEDTVFAVLGRPNMKNFGTIPRLTCKLVEMTKK
jgi:hypothetical protein